MDAIFTISSTPDSHAADIIKAMAAATFKEEKAAPQLLSRFFFTAGHLALKLLLYTESITKEVSSRRKERRRGGGRNSYMEKCNDRVYYI